MSKKNIDKDMVFVLDNLDRMPVLDDYTGTDWYRAIQDIDKPKLNVTEEDSMHTPINEALKLEFVFKGHHSPHILEQLVTYWIKQRDKLIKRLKEQNINTTTLIGIDTANDILKYERAIWISISKYIQHQNQFKILCESQKPTYPMTDYLTLKLNDLPKSAANFEPYYGFDVLKNYCADILDRTFHDNIDISDDAVAAILNDKGIKMDGACPTTKWNDISFLFTDPNHIEFTHDDRMEIIIASDRTGLRTKDGKYSEVHSTLMKFAIARGQITTAMRRRVHKVNVNQKNVSRLRSWLKELTGRSDNPIKYTQVEGYVCQFNIQQNIYHMTPEGYIKRDDADIED